jgi:hypothetical protein
MDQVAGPTPRKPGFTPRPDFPRVTSLIPRQYHFINAQYEFVTDTICNDNWRNNLNKKQTYNRVTYTNSQISESLLHGTVRCKNMNPLT